MNIFHPNYKFIYDLFFKFLLKFLYNGLINRDRLVNFSKSVIFRSFLYNDLILTHLKISLRGFRNESSHLKKSFPSQLLS